MKGLTLKNTLQKALAMAFFYLINHEIKVAFIPFPEEVRL